MKPRFALDLTDDAVSLLERADGGWALVAKVPFDDTELDGRLASLGKLADEHAPDGFVSKLILPNSQILYFEASAPGPDRATRRTQIRAALAGRTPYDVDDLVFDFTGSGQTVSVAVVARITLQEAEAFADAKGFRPAAFVAVPEPGRFAGEPFFGLTETAGNWLGDTGRYDRDQDPVRIVAMPEAALPLASATVIEPMPEPEPEPEPLDMAEPVPVGEDLHAGVAQGTAAEADADEAPFIDIVEDDDPAGTQPDVMEADATAALVQPDPPVERPQVSPEPAPAPQAAAFQSSRHPASDSPAPDHSEAPGSRLADIVPRLGRVTAARATGAPIPRLRPDAVPGPATLRQSMPDISPTEEKGVERVAALITRREQTSGMQAPSLSADRPIFGAAARGALTAASGDLPRLAAAALAVLLLAGVLFWAFLRTGDPQTVAEETAPAVTTSAATTAPPAQATPPTTEATEPEPDLARPTVAAAPPAGQAVAPAPDNSGATALTGEVASAPPATLSALPDPATQTSDRALPGQPLPQPFGTLVRYDANGLIMATADGVVTPGGFTLIAGAPPRRPAARPDRIAPVPVAAPVATAPDAPFADPALAGKTPRTRPAGLILPPVAAPQPDATLPDATLPDTGPPAADDGASLPPLAPPADSRHAAKTPKARPAAVQAAAEARRQQDEAMADAAASAARAEAEAAAAALSAASPQAVASSRRPAARSAKALAAAATAQTEAATETAVASVDTSAVDAALAEAQTAPEPEPEPAAAEPVAPSDVEEPEPEPGIATLPTTRTVAKKSTYANAIDLGDVNLIGVYGSSANRRALVRMPNGRFVKVKVGDRLDGGSVAAIGDAELRYVKKGKTIVLKIMKNG